MHVKAMQKARAALARAEQNLASLKASNGFSAIEEHWEQLLEPIREVPESENSDVIPVGRLFLLRAPMWKPEHRRAADRKPSLSE